MSTPLQINMGGNTVFTTTAGIKFADGTEQDTAATGGGGGNATAIQGTAVSSTPPDHNGELLIYDSVQNKYVPGDPLVQGLFPEGTATSSINPVLVSGKGIDGNQHSLSVDNTGAIAVSNFPATQPVSGTVGVNNFPATQATSSTQLPAVLDGSGFLKVHEQGTVPVTGTFFQTTQPVSGTVTANAGSGTFVVDASGHTVPVSGTVAVNNFPATQPVSGTVTANAGSGTFAVSAASLPLPSGASTSAKQPALGTAGVASADVITVQGVASMTPLKVDGSAVTQPVSGTFFQATQPISGAISFTAPQHTIVDSATLGTVVTNATLSAETTKVIGTVNQGTSPWVTSLASTTITGTVAVSAVSLPLPTGAATSANQTTPVSKGVQGTTAEPVQDLKDSGRVIKVFSATFTAATSEAMITLTPISDGTAGSTGTTFTVTSGKRFRIQTLLVTVINAGAAVQGVVTNLRIAASGSVTTASPLVATTGAGTSSATANVVASNGEGAIPDGLELSGTMQFGISQIGTATAGNRVTLIGYEY